MEQLTFGMMLVEKEREERVEVNLAPETVEVLVTLMARAMMTVVRGAKEKDNEG